MSRWINQENLSMQTPYYVFDIDALRERAALIKEKAAKKGVSVCYAMKANAFVTPYIADLVDAYEVCSHGEFKLCKEQKLDLSKVVLSGVNKEEAFVEDGILSGAGIITAESITHYQYIQKYSEAYKKNVKVILRLSCNAQFGMDQSVLEGIIANRDKDAYITIIGIHYFTGTQKKKVKKMITELEKVAALIQLLKEKYDYEAELLEYGPGSAVSYFEGDAFDQDMQEFDALLDYIDEAQYSYHVTLEMGRFYAAACGSYVTGIADYKVNDGLNVCIIDGGKNHLSYYGQNMALKTPIINQYKQIDGSWVCVKDAEKANAEKCAEGAEKADAEECAKDAEKANAEKCAEDAGVPENLNSERWTLFGSLCSFHDIIARDVELKELQLGDRLIFENVGAYSITEGMYLFLSRPMPEVYLCENGKLKLVREQFETYKING